MVFEYFSRSLGANDDDSANISETEQMTNTLYLNLVLFCILGVCFEIGRHSRSIYLNRLTRRFIKNNRVPPLPSKYPLGWIFAVINVSDEQLLAMIGLDGYMLMRYITICLRIGFFFCFWGILVLAPIYKYCPGGLREWDSFTIANIYQSPSAHALWAPVVFCYLFAAYFCQLMYNEYRNFVIKRTIYLENGDSDSAVQAYYTVMVERVPNSVRSAPALHEFFEKLFPGEVYSVEVALDLKELEDLTYRRKLVRNQLEKSIALSKATNARPTMWIHKDYYKEKEEQMAAERESTMSQTAARIAAVEAPTPVMDSMVAKWFNHIVIDSIEHYTKELNSMNIQVQVMQQVYFDQRQKMDEQEEFRILEVKKALLNNRTHLHKAISQVGSKISDKMTTVGSTLLGGGGNNHSERENLKNLNTSVVEEDLDSVGNQTNNTSNTNSNNRADNNSPALSAGGVFGVDSDKEAQQGQVENIVNPMLANNKNNNNNNKDVVYHTTNALDISKAFGVPLDPNTHAQQHHHQQQQSHHHDSDDDSGVSHNPDDTSVDTWRSYPVLSDDSYARDATQTAAGSKAGGSVGSRNKKEVRREKARGFLNKGREVIGQGIGGLTKESIRHAEFATKGALRGVMEGARALEILTFGTNYKTSSTAFVTFKSRNAACSSQQMLLSNKYYDIIIKPAPNPKDILWNNVSIPQKQINLRHSIADAGCYVGAVFWSIVVTFISAISNLTSISKDVPGLAAYSNTSIYQFLNDYLAIGILLILLAILPAVFDFISRYYEGIKLESEIQSSIMTRFFYYQLANVFVSVGLGSIANSLHEILDDPTAILEILGLSLPSFSIYFTNLIIVKTLTQVPIEMLRAIPLIDILRVVMCMDRKKCTRRELRTGAFADPPMLYGWIYPSLLMVLMIMVTYSCIAPFLMPFCTLFFALAWLMYRYQLLYVYINEDQSGGFMWYAVFNRSMVALCCGVATLLCYMAIRKTYTTGPFYALFPLPFMIVYFWHWCDKRFQKPALTLSLEGAKTIDAAVAEKKERGEPIPLDQFKPTLFRQPSLNEGMLKPAAYRKVRARVDETKSVVSGVDGERASDVTGDLEQDILSPNSKMNNNKLAEERYFDETGSDYDSDYERGGDSEDEDIEVEEDVNQILETRPSRLSFAKKRHSGNSSMSDIHNDTSPRCSHGGGNVSGGSSPMHSGSIVSNTADKKSFSSINSAHAL